MQCKHSIVGALIHFTHERKIGISLFAMMRHSGRILDKPRNSCPNFISTTNHGIIMMEYDEILGVSGLACINLVGIAGVCAQGCCWSTRGVSDWGHRPLQTSTDFHHTDSRVALVPHQQCLRQEVWSSGQSLWPLLTYLQQEGEVGDSH